MFIPGLSIHILRRLFNYYEDEIPSVQLDETNDKNENKLDQRTTLVKNEPEESLVFGVASFNN